MSTFIPHRRWLLLWAPTGTQTTSAASAAGSPSETRVRLSPTLKARGPLDVRIAPFGPSPYDLLSPRGQERSPTLLGPGAFPSHRLSLCPRPRARPAPATAPPLAPQSHIL